MPFALRIKAGQEIESLTTEKGGAKKEKPKIDPLWIVTDKRIKKNKIH